METETILPITGKGNIRSYAHWSYPMAILENDLDGIKNTILEVELLPEERKRRWNFWSKGVQEESENNVYRYLSDRWAKEREFFKYRPLLEKEQFVAKIWTLCYNSANTIFNILVGDLSKNRQDVQIAIMCKRGLHLAVNGEKVESEFVFRLKFPVMFKIERKNAFLDAYISYDGKNWDLLLSYEIANSEGPLHIGYNLNCYDNQIMNWKYSNFIQLKYNNKLDVYFDYYTMPKRDVRYHYLNNFLETVYSSKREILELFGTLGRACKWNLARGKYCILWLDEFFLKKRDSYQDYHYKHPNMIYGFSGSSFYVLGYSQNGRLVETKESVEIIEKSFQNIEDDSTFELLRYNPNDCDFVFDEEFVLEQIREYALGINSSKKTSNIISREEAVYGIKTYDYILKDKLFIHDLRISYLIYEHNNLMAERFAFMQTRNNKYCNDKIKAQIDSFNTIVETSKKIMWMVIKNGIQTSVAQEKKIELEFKVLIEQEREFYRVFINLVDEMKF